METEGYQREADVLQHHPEFISIQNKLLQIERAKHEIRRATSGPAPATTQMHSDYVKRQMSNQRTLEQEVRQQLRSRTPKA